jgi:lipopolysaccharide export system permease protein
MSDNFSTILNISGKFWTFLIFYNLSAKFKFFYLDLKNDYASDDKYLAVINENGLWIRDEIDGNINIINADKIEENYLVFLFKIIKILFIQNINWNGLL